MPFQSADRLEGRDQGSGGLAVAEHGLEMLLFGTVDPLDEILAELRKYPAWPADDKTDRPFLQDLHRKYGSVDLKEEAFKWRIWMMDHKQSKEVKPRARFANWVRNSEGKRPARPGAGKNRTNKIRIAPARREEFGESSKSLGSW